MKQFQTVYTNAEAFRNELMALRERLEKKHDTNYMFQTYSTVQFREGLKGMGQDIQIFGGITCDILERV